MLDWLPRHVVLLRGINVARHNRIAMAELRAALEADGFGDVKSYVQSGNIVVSSRASSDRVAKKVNALIKTRFGMDIVVIVRSYAQLAGVVRRNPLAKVAVDPKRYLVTFASADLPASVIERMRTAASPSENFAVIGREVYSWHPVGVGRSPLWEKLSAKAMGIVATSRNWSTVTALLAIALESTAG